VNTVAHKRLVDIWNSKVIVDEIRQFKDSRGFLSELWRSDDDTTNVAKPEMSYWSVTNPLVMRGPHEHALQVDFFITWFGRMVYQLYNPATDEMFHFITDPSCIYRIKVDIGIIHSYRNLELRPITTGNFPSSLFMGKDKAAPIDEIRHEEKIGEDLKTYVILGAGGRLGKALTKLLYKNMGYHKYHVIPIYEKLHDKASVQKVFEELFKEDPFLCSPSNTHIINCAGLTNVQSLKEFNSQVQWANIDLPIDAAGLANMHGCKFYHISSDYVFRENDESPYTQSKILAEKGLEGTNAHIIRVANLFSLDETDKHNIISKLKEKVKTNETISADPSQVIFPTEVGVVAHEIVKYIDKEEKGKDINICGTDMTIKELYNTMGGKTVRDIKSPVIFNHQKFTKNCIFVDCVKEINLKISQ
jgi:dTDP-4-dehydrorhamnose reductase/dTDP-4-dehydrorhamnose 3,5-epimerase-like enzyme